MFCLGLKCDRDCFLIADALCVAQFIASFDDLRLRRSASDAIYFQMFLRRTVLHHRQGLILITFLTCF